MEVSPAVPHPPAADPETLHPALWRASQIGRAPAAVRATGFAELDAELPGGGWPAGALTELLLPHPGVGEWRLLAPALAVVMQGSDAAPARPVLLFDPPGEPCSQALAALGLDLRQLVIVRGRGDLPARARARLPAADTLWAMEQALASGHVGAALAWLPARLRADALRRLQLAAQANPGPVFLFREMQARARPSAAPLRLQLAAGAPDTLRLHVLKRRGPPQAAPLVLALPPVLSARARARVAQPAAPAEALPA